MLWQYRCEKSGTLFYHQWSGDFSPQGIIDRCPSCGSKRVKLTGRSFLDVDEYKPSAAEIRLRVNDLRHELIEVFADEKAANEPRNSKAFREWVKNASEDRRHPFQKVAKELLSLTDNT